MLPALVAGLEGLNYPRTQLDILLLCEEDDEESIIAIEAMNLPPHFRLIVVPDAQPKTKPKACNYGLMLARGDVTVIYDAEDRPDPDQLKKVIVAFSKSNPNVTCIQAKLNYYNPDQNLLTRWFTTEYSMWFELLLPGLDADGAPIPLGGTSNHFITERLRDLGAWDPYNVTEDADLGIRLHKAGYRTAMVDSTTLEEANSDLKNWIRQRSRWIKGYIQTYLVHMRNPVKLLSQSGVKGFISFQLLVGGTFIFLLNPIFWALTTIFFITQAGFIQALFPTFVFYLAASMLFVGNFVFLYLNVAGSIQRGLFGLAKYALLTPLYWGLMSLAAWKGFFQLITNPFYWEKTTHGLHTAEADRRPAPGRRDARRRPRRRPDPPRRRRPRRSPSASSPARRRTVRQELIRGHHPAAAARAAGLGRRSRSESRPSACPRTPSTSPRRSPRRAGSSSLLLFVVAAGVYFYVGYQTVVEDGVVVFDALDRLTRAYMVWHNEPPKLAAIGFVFPPLTTMVFLPFTIDQAARDVARRAAADVGDLRRLDGRRDEPAVRALLDAGPAALAPARGLRAEPADRLLRRQRDERARVPRAADVLAVLLRVLGADDPAALPRRRRDGVLAARPAALLVRDLGGRRRRPADVGLGRRGAESDETRGHAHHVPRAARLRAGRVDPLQLAHRRRPAALADELGRVRRQRAAGRHGRQRRHGRGAAALGPARRSGSSRWGSSSCRRCS